MKFNTHSSFLNWVSQRYLNNELAYAKNMNQEIIYATNLAMSKLGIISGQSLHDCPALIADSKDIIKIDESIIHSNTNTVVIENWYQESTPKVLMWTKRPIIVNNENYFLVEEYINVNFTVKKILTNSQTKVKNYLDKSLLNKFTNKEKIICYLLIHGFTTAEIAAHLFVSNSTVKTYLYRHIASKFKNYGFDIDSKEQITKVATILGFGDHIPEELFNKFLTVTLILNFSWNGDSNAKIF